MNEAKKLMQNLTLTDLRELSQELEEKCGGIGIATEGNLVMAAIAKKIQNEMDTGTQGDQRVH